MTEPELNTAASSAPDPTASSGSSSPASINQGLPLASAIDDAAQQAFLWRTHDYLANYARFADTKAAFAGTIAGALLGSLYSAKEFAPLIQAHWSTWQVTSWLALMAGTTLCMAIAFAIRTVYPRLKSSSAKGFVFWGNIAAHKSISELRTSFTSQTAASLNDQLLTQNYDVSRYVCIPKYRNVSMCIILLAVGASLAAGALLLTKTPPVPQAPSAPPVSATASEAPWGYGNEFIQDGRRCLGCWKRAPDRFALRWCLTSNEPPHRERSSIT